MTEKHSQADARTLLFPACTSLMAMIMAVLLALMPLNADQTPDLSLQQFDAFSAGLQSFSASFEQIMFDANGQQEEFSEGVFYLQQPDLMHWKYEHPYPQLIVADGSTLWSWDI
jgi:outer membrane lipoprotein carrier protein